MSRFLEIAVKCTAKMATQLVDGIRLFIEQDELSRMWQFVDDAVWVNDAPRVGLYLRDGAGSPKAFLLFGYQPAGETNNEGGMKLVNVVPMDKQMLEPDEYNSIAEQFADEVVEPVVKQRFPNMSCIIEPPDAGALQADQTGENLAMDNSDEENAFDGRFADFKIGVDTTGSAVMHTCNPDRLANFFGANPGSPFYLTRVYFTLAVLDKYRDQPSRYDVESGCLRCKNNGRVLWCIPIDNHGQKCVSAWLGDLGHLPYQQQLHFASCNITKGEMSSTFFKTQLEAEFCESNHPVEVFKNSYYRLREVGWETLAWHFFLPLAEGDRHYMSSLKLLTHDEQKEFDEQVLALTKILIDSLNEEKFRNFVPGAGDIHGIALLAEVCKQQNIPDADRHIQFLRKLQKVRSTSVAHRKGTGYDKARELVGLDTKTFSEVLENFFVEAANLVQFVLKNIASFKQV